jgi:hypothetical protein
LDAINSIFFNKNRQMNNFPGFSGKKRQCG